MSAVAGTRPGRVLLVVNNFPPVRGGSGIVYANLATFARGAVVVLAPSIAYADGLPTIGWREYDRRASFPVHRIPLLRTTMVPSGGSPNKLLLTLRDLFIRLRVLWSVLRLCLRTGCRTVCVGELLASSWLLRVLHFVPGLRGVVYVHGEEITTRDHYDPDFRRRSAGLSLARRIFVVSRFSRGALESLLPDAPRGRIVLIENGVDRGRFFPAPREPWLVERYGLEGHFVLVTICRLLEKKGVDNALRAFARLHAEDPSTRYLIVGVGPYAPQLHALSASLGLEEAATFVGSVEDAELAAHYRLGDVFVMPNRALPDGDTEGFGLVFLEANACGLPVIAGRDGGSADAVTDGVNGLVVDGNSVDEIAAAMIRLRRDDALRDRLARQGEETAARADWETRTEAFLKACLDEG